MKIAIILGTRPEIIKMQPIIKEIKQRDCSLLTLIHTGQHYDWNMSDSFIKELEIPEPNIFLNVRSGLHGYQTARIITRSERALKKEKPNIVLVEGDTNSALGTAIAASKLKINVGHVEAGCRSFDKIMPEEINRILIADLASLHFAPTETCVKNLLNEGIPRKQIHLTGHPIVDLLDQVRNKINENQIDKFGLKPREYYLVTAHREENVDDKARFQSILEALSVLAESAPVIFPMHPHTLKSAKKFRAEPYLSNLKVVNPVSYFEALSLIKSARIVLTDSGGIQQEGALLGTPCITLRTSTEWVETIEHGVNFLAKSKEEIITTAKRLENEHDTITKRFVQAKNIFGKPHVAARIVDILEKLYN